MQFIMFYIIIEDIDGRPLFFFNEEYRHKVAQMYFLQSTETKQPDFNYSHPAFYCLCIVTQILQCYSDVLSSYIEIQAFISILCAYEYCGMLPDAENCT